MKCKRYFLRYIAPLPGRDERQDLLVEEFKTRLLNEGWEDIAGLGFTSPVFERLGEAEAEARMIRAEAPGGVIQVVGVARSGSRVVKAEYPAGRGITPPQSNHGSGR